MKMRRKDRQLSTEETWQIVEKSNYAVVAMPAEDGTPYCVPVNVVRDGEKLYFHGAREGRKPGLLQKSPRVCVNCVTRAEADQDRYTTLYESAILFGTAREVTDPEERAEAMRKFCLHYVPERMDLFEKTMHGSFAATAMWCIDVESITGKRNR